MNLTKYRFWISWLLFILNPQLDKAKLCQDVKFSLYCLIQGNTPLIEEGQNFLVLHSEENWLTPIPK